MINVNKFERLRRSFKVIHLRLHSRHRLIHLFIHLLFSLVLILSFNGGLSHRPAKQHLGSSGSCLLYLCFCFVFFKKNCRLCVISHPCLTSIRTFPQPPPACRGVWETTFAFECSNTEKSIFGFSLLLVHPFIHWLDCFALLFRKTEKLFFSEICLDLPSVEVSHI